MVWVGHSCPTPLMLVLALNSRSAEGKFNCKIKINSDGQECPSHTNHSNCFRKRSS